MGLTPDLLMCRCDVEIDEATRKKLSLFCQVPPEMVISLHDVSNLYQVPLLLAEQAVGRLICEQLGLRAAAGEAASAVAPTLPLGAATLPSSAAAQRLGDWRVVADRVEKCTEEVSIALVGKYMGNPDAYVSVVKALQHAAIEAGLRLVVSWVDSCKLQPGSQKTDQQGYEDSWEKIRSAQGVLVPGGFGGRGIEGKIACEAHCRETRKPFLGICVGLQSAVIEFARNEFDEETPHPVVVFLPEASATVMGGTMRLGSRAT